MVLGLLGLYANTKAWAGDKSQMEMQLALTRQESLRLVTLSESQLKDTQEAHAKLESQVQELQDKLARSDVELTAAKAKLEEANSEQVKLRGQVVDLQRLAKVSHAGAASIGDGWDGVGKVPVWVWWDFQSGVPTAMRLNVRTWMAHMNPDKFELRLVNKSNIKTYVPDLPDAFFR